VDCFSASENVDAFYFLLDGFEVVAPACYDIFHWGWRGGKSHVCAVVVKDGVVLCEEGILYEDLYS